LLAAPTVAPALVVAAVVHGELLALRPFGFGSGLVARAAGRAVLISRGVDPLAVLAPSAGLTFLGRSAYVSAARAYLSGTPGGLAAWVLHCCLAVERAVDETRVLLA
jgi:Fic family protein